MSNSLPQAEVSQPPQQPRRFSGIPWLRRMTRSKQVIAAVTSAFVAGGLALLSVILAGSPSNSKPPAAVTNSISNSTVNQYYAGGPSSSQASSGGSSSCSEPKSIVGSSTLLVRMEQKALGTPCWTAELAPVSPGAIIRYIITYENLSYSVQHNVIIRASLPPKVSLVPNSTYIYNSSFPKGLLAQDNAVDDGGVIIGNYSSGAGAYVVFSAAVPFGSDLTCGWNDFRAVGVVHPSGLDEFYNTAEIQVDKTC
jgi:uncharacterized repeat protein (TIGR01451 family)